LRLGGDVGQLDIGRGLVGLERSLHRLALLGKRFLQRHDSLIALELLAETGTAQVRVACARARLRRIERRRPRSAIGGGNDALRQ